MRESREQPRAWSAVTAGPSQSGLRQQEQAGQIARHQALRADLFLYCSRGLIATGDRCRRRRADQ